MGSGKKLSRRGGNHGAVNPANGDGGERYSLRRNWKRIIILEFLVAPTTTTPPPPPLPSLLFLLLPLFRPAFYLAALKNKTEGGPRLNNG